MSTWKARLTKSLTFPSRRMHSFPCSALLACFGNTRENAAFDQSSSADTHSTIYVQPTAKAGRHPSHPKAEDERAPEKRRDSGMRSERNGSANGNNSKHTVVQPAETPESVPRSLNEEPDCEAVTFQTSIPRPSIIDMPKVSEFSQCCHRWGGVGGGENSAICGTRSQTFCLNSLLHKTQGILASDRKCGKAFKFSEDVSRERTMSPGAVRAANWTLVNWL